MNEYVIMTDSCIDLTAKMAEEMDLTVIPLSVTVEGRSYRNFLDEKEIACADFYQMLREKKTAVTSQPNPEHFIEAMEPLLKSGLDILSISFSSALSGTFNSSRIAKEELETRYPERKIIIIDSLCASMGQGLLISYAADLKKQGKTIVEVAEWVEKNKKNICHLFTVGDLNHLARGGRLSHSKAIIGTLLKIKPLLHVNEEGKLVQTGATRGRHSALVKMAERMTKTITEPAKQIIYISHGDCLADAETLKSLILERLPVKDIIINYVGPVIGGHSGINTLALFYLGNDRFLEY